MTTLLQDLRFTGDRYLALPASYAMVARALSRTHGRLHDGRAAHGPRSVIRPNDFEAKRPPGDVLWEDAL